MSYNYKSLWGQICLRKSQSKNDHSHAVPLQSGMFSSLSLFCVAAALSLFGAANAFAQTTKIIDPAGDGGFNSGSTFAENGWTVANEGTGPIKWVVGTAVNSGAITGNSAYITVDEGLHNAYAGVGVTKTVFFYRDVTLPAGQTNIALSFNYRSGVSAWQVYVAPTSVTPVGNDTSLFLSNPPFPNSAVLAGATPVILGVANATTVQKATGFIPASFAGSTVRLIFMWSNPISAADPPLAVDNISLFSRVGGQQLSSIATGNYSDATTWDKGYVPSPTDNAIVQAGHTVTLDNKNMSVQNLYIAGGGATVQFGTDTDEFTVNSDLSISGTGAKFNVFNGTNGRSLKVGGNIDLYSEGRLDVSVGNANAGVGQLVLFGATPQTINAEAASNFGGTTVTTTSTNAQGIINQLIVNNTSASPTNITWNANNVRIKNVLQLNKARVSLATNKIILGNYSTISTLVAPFGNGFKNGTVSRWYATSATGTAVVPGTDHNPNTNGFFPILSSNNQNRSPYVISTGTASTAGELSVTYASATTITSGLNIVDGSYTVTDRYNGGWTVAANGYVNTTGTFTFGTYASGAFEAKDGSLRIINNSALVPSGQHNNGTTTPFVSRKGMTLADLTANPLYIGFNSASVLGAATKTSAANGDWNTAATWTPSGVPADTDIVKIAHTVTNNGTARAAAITINSGATLINASNDLTVGVTNNNAILANYGTFTVSGGTVNVNGALAHKSGSTFNQTGGNINIDSNAAGVAANSVGIGGSSLRIDTSSLNLTDGTITIVDPLINNAVATTATSGSAFNLDTYGATGTFTRNTKVDLAIGSSIVEMDGLNANKLIYGIGQVVTGTGIADGTTITSVNQLTTSGSNIVLGLSNPATAAITAGSSLTFTAMTNGCSTINIDANLANTANVAVGQIVTGTGIPAGTTVSAFAFDNASPKILGVKLSKPATTTISAPVTLAFSAVSENCATVILSAANASIVAGQPVGGPGIAPGTTVSAISGTKLDLSLPTIAGITDPVTLSFYDSNNGSCAVVYNSPNHYAAGPNHTLQIGDGVSTDKAPVVTNGYLCDFAQAGGLLSLGKLKVNALLPTERFFNTLNRVNVQGDLTITSGSVFKKSVSTNNLYLGGNVINNGKIYLHNGTQVKLMNVINGNEVATSIPQTISGTGDFYNDLTATLATGSVPQLIVNNTSADGVTIAVPNFRVANSTSSALTMTAGIIHTTEANPLYHGSVTLSTFAPTVSGNFSDTCFIDGPYSKSLPSNSSNLTLSLYPVGKTTYKPLSIAVTGGGDFKVEVFNTNEGTASANIANLSATRWKVTRNGLTGAFTDFRVALGGNAIAANNIVVQAPADQGTYDVLGASFFAPATPPAGSLINNILTVNNISTTTALAQASFTGNFAYATVPNCTTVNPGNTVADLTSSLIVHTQAVYRTSPGNGITAGNKTVTLSSAANVLIVPGLVVSGTGIAPGSVVESVSGSTIVLSLAPTASNGTSSVTLTFSSVNTPSKLTSPRFINLSLENNADGNGVTYQWQNSTDGLTYNDITGATAATYNTYAEASTYFRCAVTCPNGPVTKNSTPVFVEFVKSTVVTPGTACVGSAITLTSDSPTATWYAEAKGGESLATGLTYAPTPADTKTYYVSNDGAAYTAGRSFSGTSTNANNFTGLVFNALADIRLNSVKIYPKQTTGKDPQPLTIKLFDGKGVEMPGTTVVFTPRANNTLSATVFDIVPLNYYIPAGTGYKLLVTNGLSADNALGVFPNGGLAGAVPVGAGSVAITGSAASFTALESTNYDNFFDLNVTDVTPRVPVTATVINTPAPTAPAAQAFCNSAKGSDLTVTTGIAPKWYKSETGGTAIDNAENLATGSYFVSQTANNCESTTRAAVAVTVNVTPAPEAAASQAFCNAGKVADLAVTTGEHIKWYDAATQGTALTNDDALSTTTYHVSQTIDGCESIARTAVTVKVIVTPAPTGEAVQCACTTGTIADFVVTGDENAIFTWYDADGTVILPSTPQVLDTTYYVTQTIGGCEGPKLAVKSSGNLSTDNFKIAELRYYPNPVTDQLTITAKDAISKVEVYNLLGQQLKVVDSNSNNTQINFSNYAPSTYLVKVYSENNTQIFKVIKK